MVFPGGRPAPQTPWTWRSGARAPCDTHPILAKLPSAHTTTNKKRKKREDAMKKTIKKTIKTNQKRQHQWNQIHGSGAKRRFHVFCGARSGPPILFFVFCVRAGYVANFQVDLRDGTSIATMMRRVLLGFNVDGIEAYADNLFTSVDQLLRWCAELR